MIKWRFDELWVLSHWPCIHSRVNGNTAMDGTGERNWKRLRNTVLDQAHCLGVLSCFEQYKLFQANRLFPLNVSLYLPKSCSRSVQIQKWQQNFGWHWKYKHGRYRSYQQLQNLTMSAVFTKYHGRTTPKFVIAVYFVFFCIFNSTFHLLYFVQCIFKIWHCVGETCALFRYVSLGERCGDLLHVCKYHLSFHTDNIWKCSNYFVACNTK